MPLTRNMPTEDGRKAGEIIARFADQAQPAYAASFSAQGMPVPQRCRTCAFRLGTHPNGCPTTVLDALKCAMEHVDFRCHDKDAQTSEGPQVCTGWAMIVSEDLRAGREPAQAPWPFSDDPKGY